VNTYSPNAIELPNVARWFADELPDRGRPVAARAMLGGRSNLTFQLELDDGTSVVLRRPPMAGVTHTAHDVHREYRVQSALTNGGIPVPRPLGYCPDTSMIGAPFFIMEVVTGSVLRDARDARDMRPPIARRLGALLADTLADIHSVDVEALGLGGLGRPDGYLNRQLRCWSQRWEHASFALRDAEATPEFVRLVARLENRMPRRSRVGLLHGDYRLDNAIVQVAETPRIAAVLDWELSTLGDPLADLGLTLVHWSVIEELRAEGIPLEASAVAGCAFGSGADFAQRYADRSGLDLSQLDFYLGLGCVKLAAVLSGVIARAVQTSGSVEMPGYAAAIPALLRRAHAFLDHPGEVR
jgi:aminoglycoside phosphotransferase (APT) family kinase protein